VFPIPGRIATYARMAEQDGWDRIAVTDSQTNNGDAFCALNVAGFGTQPIKLTTSAGGHRLNVTFSCPRLTTHVCASYAAGRHGGRPGGRCQLSGCRGRVPCWQRMGMPRE
jgi:hypothetical protein